MDEFTWLEQLDDQCTIEWLKHQKERIKLYFSSFQEWDEIYQYTYELLSRERITSLIALRHALVYIKRLHGAKSSLLCIRDAGGGAQERVLMDSANFGEQNRISFLPLAESDNGQYLIFAKRYGSKYEYEPSIIEISSGEEIKGGLDVAHYRGVLLVNNYLIYAQSRNSQWKVYRRPLGDPGTAEEILFDPRFDDIGRVSVSLSECGRYFLYLLIKRGPPRTATILRQSVCLNTSPEIALPECSTFHGGYLTNDSFLYLSSESSPMKRVVLRDLQMHQEKEIVSECAIPAMRMIITSNSIVVKYVENWRSYLICYDFNGNEINRIDFNEPGEISELASSSKSRYAYFRYSSYSVTGHCYCLNTESGMLYCVAESSTSKNSNIEIQKFDAHSEDGTIIPVITARNIDCKPNENTPVLLTAYGGYGSVVLPSSSVRATMWMNMGGVIALAAVRGGGEFGEVWRMSGSLERRSSSINDFIAAAEFLHKKGIGTHETLAITGASHAGFLVAAAMVRRPDLFRVVVCSSALLDLLALDRSLHGNWAIQEFGSPSDLRYREILKQISPYENIEQGVEYPSVLFIAGGEDTMVDPWHIFKMTAKLQAANVSTRPILLDYSEIYGHRGELPIAMKAAMLTNQLMFIKQSLKISS